ncbi:hypothetical protein PE067_19755 [Paracoccus sp. DMF-8]|uniref:DUF2946 family protein n=1 Tax=Paracoccus sp. DMF-8 TaxID=3019445 RepID=UPI0023E3B9CA|nr:DUF2946 family protein [Paracoccus sp. DMF-8]MDF3608178.1 hypothetical protein [Paracoccus sp. DMF-8]
MALALLAVLSLLMAGQMRAAMPFSGPLTAVVICHEQQVTTIWVDADGNEHPPAGDCRDCTLCAMPAPVLAGSAEVVAPRPIHRADAPRPRHDLTAGGPDRRTPPTRAPPSPSFQAASA